MDITRGTLYGVYVLIYFHLRPQGHVADLHTLSQSLEIPESYLSKVLQQLHKSSYLMSQMGSKGGYRLNKNVETTTMREVLQAMQGQTVLQECLTDHYDCNRFRKCAVIHHVREIQNVVNNMLDQLTIGKLSTEMEFKDQKFPNQVSLGVQ